MRLDQELAEAFARVAIGNIERPYPHKLDHLLLGPAKGVDHVSLHPVFFGSYDWHSAVHMHWLLVRMLRLQPAVDAALEAAALLDRQLAVEAIARELYYCRSPVGATFERPYGWAWLLTLQAELVRLRPSQPRAAAWAAAVEPLAAELAGRLAEFLRAAPYPIRTGTHGNTAFACLLAGDYAKQCRHAGLVAAIRHAAGQWYGRDRDARPTFEPSLTDFLSPILCEAAIMADVLPQGRFATWFDAFLPTGLGPLAEPPVVSDRTDPQVAHLDGLCLSRAWCLRQIVAGLPADHAQIPALQVAAETNLEAGLPHTVGGDYVGEHWLASFAALAIGEPIGIHLARGMPPGN